jgi:hypothetical protein
MHRLDTLLRSAADPSLLEFRILARHAADPRFAFLRPNGRFRAEWQAIRAAASTTAGTNETKPPAEASNTSLGSLAAYGDSSDEDG